MRADPVENLAAAFETEMSRQGGVETDVQRIEARTVARFGGDRRLAQIFLQRRPALVFQPPRRLGRDFAFDRAANEQPLAHILAPKCA